MALTAKQTAALAKEWPSRRKALRKQFEAQNASQQKQQQPQKKKPAAKPAARAAKKKVVACRNFLDPKCPDPAPRLVSVGKALPLTGLASHEFTVGSENRALLIITNLGSSGSVGVFMQIAPNGTAVSGSSVVLTIPTLAQAEHIGGPTAASAMKFGVTVTNCTNAWKRGGRVKYINSSQRLPPCWDGDGNMNWARVLTGIETSPYRVLTTGDQLVQGKQLIGYPTDRVEYETFHQFEGQMLFGKFTRHVCSDEHAPTGSESLPRGMSIVAYVFENTADPQDYSVTVRASYYTRWPITSVPGQSMKQIPTSDAAHINAVHDHAEQTAHDMVKVAEGGVMATMGPRVAAAARGALGRLSGLAEAAGAAAEEGLVLAAEEAGAAGALAPFVV